MTILRSALMTISFVLTHLGHGEMFAADPSVPNAQTALRNRSYPWYDASRDSFRPLHPEKDIEPPSAIPGSEFHFPIVQFAMWILLGLVIALILIGLFQWMQSLSGPVAPDQHPVAEIQISLKHLEALPDSARNVRDLLGEAARLASVADFGQAIVFYYSWQLVQLDKQQALELQKGKTNRRYLGEMAQSRRDLAEVFRLSIRLFEDAFFGRLNVSRDDFERIWSQRAAFDASKGRPRT